MIRNDPGHDRDCLHLKAAQAPCRCRRQEWLAEYVPRSQARREVLDQIATWASEQRAFTEMADQSIAGGRDLPQWAKQALRSGRVVAGELYVQVRMTALAKLKELPESICSVVPPDHPSRTGEAPTPARPAAPPPRVEPEEQPESVEENPLWQRRLRGRDINDAPVQGALL